MDRSKYKISKNILTVIILLLLPIYIIKQLYFTDNDTVAEASQYVGKEACIECHQAEYNDWKGSDHDLAMDFANDTTVLGDFNNAKLIRNSQTHKAYKKNNLFYISTDGADGKMQEFQVKYVFGHFPLQNYLVEFPGGRLQTIALTWNSLDSNWFYMADSVYKSMSVTHNNWLHWTNQSQNWNSMCADCHSTNLQKGYNHKTDSYHTTWSEIDVSCEACHGPASEHLRWANLAEYARTDFKNYGLPIQTSNIDNKQYVDNCARCHSRRNNFGDYDAKSNNIYNYILPTIPTEPNWHIDGQIKEEDYVYGSFIQSRMYMEDVKCNDCHNVHSGKLVLEGNALCLQCHKATDYDTKQHTFHKNYGEMGESVISDAGVNYEVGSGTECINCHMHGQNFMGVDYRRDHSFRIPRPDLSDKLGTPNACNQCHKDKTNKWAQEYIVKWFGESRHSQYGEVFFNARNGSQDTDLDLQKIIDDDLYSAPIQSIALYMLMDNNSNQVKNSLKNLEPSVRVSAVNKINLNSKENLDQLLDLLNDNIKAVRLAAYQRIIDIDTNQLSAKQKTAYNNVKQEQYNRLTYNSDFPLGKYNLANYYLSQKEYKKAEKLYLAAIKQDAELSIARMNLAHLYSIVGQPINAEQQLEQYVNENPNDGAGLYNYGLILSENKKYKQSLIALLKASELSPENNRIDYNVAMLYEFFDDNTNAEKFLQQRINNYPNYIDAYASLLEFYIRINEPDKIKELIDIIVIRFPDKQSIDYIQSIISKK